jgi:methionyl-tRNA formyltransferase
VELLKELIPRLVARDLEVVAQDPSKRTYYGKVRREDLLIDWEADTETVLRTIRAGYRFPGALASGEGGEDLVILSAERAEPRSASHSAEPGSVHESDEGVVVRTGDGWVRILSVGLEGEEVGDLKTVAALPFLGARRPAPAAS